MGYQASCPTLTMCSSLRLARVSSSPELGLSFCFRESGLKLKKHKCVIGIPQIEFLAYLVDAKEIHPTPSKVAAIKHAPVPTCHSELQ